MSPLLPEARPLRHSVAVLLLAACPVLGYCAPRPAAFGAAFYGRDFADVRTDQQGLYQHYGRYQGEHPWPELKRDYIDKGGYVRYWDAQAQAPWLWNAAARRFISYDDPQSIAAKAAYVNAMHLGGIMYWEQSLDPSGELLEALRQGLR